MLHWLSAAAAISSMAAPVPVATFRDFRYEAGQAGWEADAITAGEYRNPILPGSRSDPSIVRVGRDYYLSTASFGYWPGNPIWHSRNLVDWSLIGHAITRRSQINFDKLDASWRGMYAPDLKYHDGYFYLLNSCYSCGGIFIMRSRNPAGPWPDPTWLPLKGIDPSIFFDDDGRAYVLHNDLPPGKEGWDGHRAIWLQEIDLKTLRPVGEHVLLVDGGTHPPEHPFWIEGPHLFKRSGVYYLICAQGGTNEQHVEVAFRSRTLRGPYEARSDPILTQVGLDPRRPNRVANAGHADMVTTPDGNWWAVFLGARPYGPSDLDFQTGRETYLQRVRWREGWPVILAPGKPVPVRAPRPMLSAGAGRSHSRPNDGNWRDAFAGSSLGRQWSIVRTPAGGPPWWRVQGNSLIIKPEPIELGADVGQPSFVGTRQTHSRVVASVNVRFQPRRPEDRAGLGVLQDTSHWFALVVARAAAGGREVRLLRRSSSSQADSGTVIARAPLAGNPAVPLRLQVKADGAAISFAYAVGLKGWRLLPAPTDASFLSTRVARGFTGVMIGPVAIADPGPRGRDGG